MRVIRAGILGFCSGVSRAVEMAWNETEEVNKGAGSKNVYTLGPLIHNPAVLKVLGERGIRVLNDEFLPLEAMDSTVIIRAHGVSPAVEKKFSRHGLRILDATCPHVKESQKKALGYAEKGFKVFLAGEENHGEIAGIRGYAEAGPPGSACFVVGSPEQAEEAAAEIYWKNQNASTVLIGQTTFSADGYKAIAAAIQKYFPRLVILNTICSATADRQRALKELSGKADALIIAGGKDSSNTRRLLSLAQELKKPAWIVESPGGIPPEAGKYGTIGLCAGASTPDSLIDEIEEVLSSF